MRFKSVKKPVGIETARPQIVGEASVIAGTEQQHIQLFQAMIDLIPSALIAVDSGCRTIAWNLGAASLAKLSDDKAMGQPLEHALSLPAAILDKIRGTARSEGLLEQQPLRHELDAGGKRLEVTIHPLRAGDMQGAMIRLDDMTERLGMERVIVQAEKMLAVRVLAAEIAHKINNPLAGMVQNAQVAQGRLEPELAVNCKAAEKNGTTVEAVRGYLKDRNILEMLDAIRTSGALAADMVRNMINLTADDTKQSERQDPHKSAARNTENRDHGK